MNQSLRLSLKMLGLAGLLLTAGAFGPGGCGLQTTPCPAVACADRCAHGFAQDQNGCETCACNEVRCQLDADCAADETCSAGICAPVKQGCEGLDYRACVARADCQGFYGGDCNNSGAPCTIYPGPETFIRCEARGPVCEFGKDWTCNDLPWMNAIAGKCLADGSCQCPSPYALNPMTGKCGIQVCPALACRMDCPNGLKQDANGCDICECASDPCNAACVAGDKCLAGQCVPADACMSDGDCSLGQTCAYATASVDGGSAGGSSGSGSSGGGSADAGSAGSGSADGGAGCMPLYGTCVARQSGCASDADCALDEYCAGPSCPPGMACAQVQTCAKLPSCVDDSSCPTGSRCQLTNCGPNTNCAGGNQCLREICGQDSDCRAGETCSILAPICPPGAKCPQPAGQCVAAPQQTCVSDAQCPAGQICSIPAPICPPGTPCPKPLGVCELPPPPPPPATCTSDADCAAGQACKPDPTDPCNTDPTVQCFAPGRRTCQPVVECTSNADCAGGEVCLPDPSDVCNSPAADCFRVGRTTCQTAVRCMFDRECAGKGAFGLDLVCRAQSHLCPDPTVVGCMPGCQRPCVMLPEAACLERVDCHAVYAQVSGTSTMAFSQCQ